ncbi:MAG: hypothetical protein JOZ97_05930, partial [Candidatus Eremiobacteraeota bacterium]|nr:hypothetical protein [Candidatus Eremiobacteraeota bacterium]
MSLTQALLEHLIDYAGLFPPAQLSMPRAVEEYAAIRSGPYAWMSGRFIVPVSRITELTNCVSTDKPVSVSAIIDAGSEPRHWLSKVQDRIATLATIAEASPF